MNKEKNFLNQIYNGRVEEITNQIGKKWRREREKVKKEEWENKKLSFYTQESYLQGFIDGVNLIINCKDKK